MHAAAFVLATLVLLPYAALALAFVLLGRAIAGGSLLSFLLALVDQAAWLMPWGLLGAVVGVVVLAGLGIHPQTRRIGAAILCGLALACIATVWLLSSNRIELPELTFLSPCFVVAAYAAWRALGH